MYLPTSRMLLLLVLSCWGPPAFAQLPTQCLGGAQPSADDCLGLSYQGCCDSSGRLLYCQGGKLYCIQCATLNPECGWNPGKGYNCGTDGLPDPSWYFSMDCALCQESCADGSVCQEGKCGACQPQCAGKQCGPDGCGGNCGQCSEGKWCGTDQQCKKVPGCMDVAEVACGQTVSAEVPFEQGLMDQYPCSETPLESGEVAFRFEAAVDDTVELYVDSADDPFATLLVTREKCVAEACFARTVFWHTMEVKAGEVYYFIVEGSVQQATPFSLLVKCQSICVPDCQDKECGEDGCFSNCGTCPDEGGCIDGACHYNDGCTAWGIPGCSDCACKSCVCATDSWCCDVDWDLMCVERCEDKCGGCGIGPVCGDGVCAEDGLEDCSSCLIDCPCSADELCKSGQCVALCIADCANKECGDDGCGGECGTCPEVAPLCVENQCALVDVADAVEDTTVPPDLADPSATAEIGTMDNGVRGQDQGGGSVEGTLTPKKGNGCGVGRRCRSLAALLALLICALATFRIIASGSRP